MSAEDEDSDKQFEPSQRKLDEARKKGEIARSADLTTAASYAGFLLALMTLGPMALVSLADGLLVLFAQSDSLSVLMFEGSGTVLHGGILWSVLSGIAIWFALPAALAILSVTLQRAFLATPSKITPKLSRISPISGVKNKFGRQGFFEFAKSSAKLCIYSVILGFFLVAQIDKIIGSLQLPPRLIVVELGRMIAGLMVIVLLVSLVLGAVDFLWQRAEHMRKNRMSRKEMMDELKQSEGDPVMKQQRRQRGHDIATNKMLGQVPGADVIIVNPTHFAVALKWDRMSATAPICVAKGADEIAARIREVAHEHAIPLHSDPPTARALFAEVALGDEISHHHYQAVAAAIRFAESMKARARRSQWS